jgi:tetratricopeptide (TPR) repeat protein
MTAPPIDDGSLDLESLPVDLAARVDEVCDRFEAAWAKGLRPRIEDYLGAQAGPKAEPLRSALRRELLLSEWECRRKLGEKPTVEEYRARFPEWTALVDELFEGDTGGSGRPSGAGSTVFHFPVEPAPLHGRYVIKKFLAGGGIGEVYRAEDREIGREVALKRLRDRNAQQDRFLAEAQVTGQLEHPGIVPVHDVGKDQDGRPFYVMKLVRGQTLKDVIAAFHAGAPGDGTPREVQRHRLLERFVILCQAVAYAHSRGVVHRDLKPDNVMVGQFGETIVVDWGLAKVVGHPFVRGGNELVHLPGSSGSAPTLAGVYMGSPPYMPPELAEGHADDADERTDVYLLGATLYEILTGKAPRSGSSRDEMLEMARSVEPVPARQVKPEVPRSLEAICQKAMARRKQDRYPGAGTLAEDVQRHLAGEPVSVYREGPAARSWRWCKRHRRAVERAAAAVLVLAVILAGGASLRRAQQLRERAELAAAQAKARDEARAHVAQFRRLADQAHFFAASVLPDDDDRRAPYYDLQELESTARDAVERLKGFGVDLAGLPLGEEIQPLKIELYDLLLVRAQTRMGQRPDDPDTARGALELVDRAARVHALTRAAHQVRALSAAALGDRARADRDQELSNNPRTPVLALDHFLAGERLRRRSPAAEDVPEPDSEPDRGALEEAIECYSRALVLEPAHYWAHFQRGRCYLALGRTDDAIAELGACTALRPDAPWGYSARGLALARRKRYIDALRDLDRAVGLGSRPARLNRGLVYWYQKRYDEALDDLEAVLGPPAGERLFEAAYYRALIRLEERKYREAAEECARVVAANPGFRAVYLVRAQAQYLLNDPGAGRASFDKYLSLGHGPALDAEGAEAYRLRGRFLRRLVLEAPGPQRKRIGQWAINELQTAINRGSRMPSVYQDLGAVLDKLGQLGPAIAAYTRALQLAPDMVRTRIMRGAAYTRKAVNRLDLAEADFTQAIRDEPDRAEAHSWLGIVRASRDAPADAQREALQALLSTERIHRKSDYIAVHNVACIYAILAQRDAGNRPAFQTEAIDLLRRSIELWTLRGSGPSEIAYIQGEDAFDDALKARPDFRELLTPKPQ